MLIEIYIDNPRLVKRNVIPIIYLATHGWDLRCHKVSFAKTRWLAVSWRCQFALYEMML